MNEREVAEALRLLALLFLLPSHDLRFVFFAVAHFKRIYTTYLTVHVSGLANTYSDLVCRVLKRHELLQLQVDFVSQLERLVEVNR